jgi:hypothetical protein
MALDSQSTTYVTIQVPTSVVLAHMCHMNPTALGTLMDNEFLDQVDEDINDKPHEPATRGDVRNLALRVDLRIVKSESKLIEQMNTTGWKFFAATIGTMGAMFTVFAILITSSFK